MYTLMIFLCYRHKTIELPHTSVYKLETSISLARSHLMSIMWFRRAFEIIGPDAHALYITQALEASKYTRYSRRHQLTYREIQKSKPSSSCHNWSVEYWPIFIFFFTGTLNSKFAMK